MYENLISVMKKTGVKSVQLARLLNCRQATVSDKLNGVSKCGFYFDEAQKIRYAFFKQYDYDYLFERVINK